MPHSSTDAGAVDVTLEQAQKMAWKCYGEGHWTQAAGLCQQILQAMPQQPEAMHLLGLSAHRLGKSEPAINLIKGAIRLAASAASCNSLGNVLYELGRLQEATLAYQDAIALQPDFPQATYNLGIVLKARGQIDAAIRCYRLALKSMPEFAEAHNNLGIALQEIGEAGQAADCYRAAASLKPELAAAHYNLGNLLHSRGDFSESEACYRAALNLDPNYIDAHVQLGKLLQLLKRDAESLASFEAALNLQPENEVARHYSDALSGTNSRQAPAGYVRQLFDVMANNFDDHLVDNLNYHVPEWLSEALIAALKPAPFSLSALDLGCGTGLFGQHFHPFCRSLVGVDLSPKMLERAQAKGCYTDLSGVDVVTHLGQAPSASLDVVVAADVLVYIGELQTLFLHARRTLRPNGAFGFSIEANTDNDSEFVLRRSGRYAQSLDYVRRLASEHRMREALCKPIVIRLEAGQPVDGYLCILIPSPEAE